MKNFLFRIRAMLGRRIGNHCMRFYPDWFEEVAKRLSLVVEDKYIHNTRITYKYRKPSA